MEGQESHGGRVRKATVGAGETHGGTCEKSRWNLRNSHQSVVGPFQNVVGAFGAFQTVAGAFESVVGGIPYIIVHVCLTDVWSSKSCEWVT